MSSKSPDLRVIEATRVAPPQGTIAGHATLPLTFFDVLWVHLPYPFVERLFFYRYPHPTSQFVSSLLPSLKSSLSLTLEKFYPLSGNLRLIPETDDKFEICYIEGDSVSFTVAECNEKFEDFAGYHEREVSRFQNFIPQLLKSDELQPLFAVQVTVFPDAGIAIGITVHHAACDGTSSMQFMHEWAATCRSQTRTSSQGPLIDRNLISDPCNLYNIFHDGMLEIRKAMVAPASSVEPTLAPASSVEPTLAPASSLEPMLSTFTLSQEHIQKLKQLVLTDAKERNVSFHCSTIVVAIAYVVVGYFQAKRIDKSTRVSFGLAADYRSRLQPPLPIEYFGNCVGFVMADIYLSDLIRENGVALAAEAIGRDIKRLDDRLKGAENWIELFKSFFAKPNIGTAGSPKFKVYGVDFGWGRPEKVEIISAAKTGSMALAESRDVPGGVEIGLALPKSAMNYFKKYFENGLEQMPV
ncbi:HXXXD-type acyl-transferase family protein [Rhynchospora pubera]|uniref:HXXXD-type acyl-transferase family protein n=1 Tax=Rhynchospora pubera TaxID=906938 RepID=A0AAV8EKG6_9POAL|nr:HXXXD-type acyl-transferase family protein [Rhynchospora pubera]